MFSISPLFVLHRPRQSYKSRRGRLLLDPLDRSRGRGDPLSILKYFRPGTKKRILAGDTPEWMKKHIRGRYIQKCILSYPDWVDRKELQVLWERCRELERETGIRYVLDHIVPIDHPYVSGLSVPWNLQILTFQQNAHKGNKWNPHQLELFA